MPEDKLIEVPQSINDSSERIQKVFELQKSSLKVHKSLSVKDRKNLLKKLKKALFDNREKLQKGIFSDFKKPALETDITELYPTISEIKHTISHLSDWASKKVVDTPLSLFGTSSYVQYEPKGNTLIITPWNYPIFLAIPPIVSAIAAGNAVVLKPSEFSPNINKVIKELLASVFNENQVAVVEGDYKVSSELLKLKFDHIHFTGSPAVGKIIMKAASENLTSCTLELGGKSPTIIDESANLKDAASKIIWGKFINGGQTCIAPDYILVQKGVKNKFIEFAKEEISKKYGNSEDDVKASKDFARIVNSRHFARIKNLVEKVEENDGEVVYGGNFDATQNFISPTLVTGLSINNELMEEEIFGPILPIISFDKLDDAIEIVNSKKKPLALYVFSKKSKNINKVLNETSSGGVSINETILHISNPNLPFGGVNNSGIGKSHGKWGFIDFSNEKSVLKQHTRFGPPKLLYPPYTKLTKFVIDFTIKYL